MIESPQEERTQRSEEQENKEKVIKIIQVNINNSFTGTSQLLQFAKEEQADILVVQKPNIRGGVVRGFTEAAITMYQGTSPGTVTVILNRKITALKMENRSTEDMTVTEINGARAQSFYLVNMYIPPERSNRECFNSILEHREGTISELMGSRKEIVIAGDINSKSTAWGSRANDARGTKWMDFATNNEFVVVNEGSTPTFEGPNGERCIDVTMASEKLYNKIKNWRVNRENVFVD